ncbi:MAG TPA: pentapeptide repeat-containing protein, partial [Acidimicrobiales bacterium]
MSKTSIDTRRWARLAALVVLSTASCAGVLVGAPAAQAVSRCANFSPGADLSNCNLTGANLSGKNLTGANLTGTNLKSANLTNVRMSKAKVGSANFTGSTLAGVFSGGLTGYPTALPSYWGLVNGYLVGPDANLTGATLAGANLSFAHLAGATITNASFAGANLYGVRSGNVTGPPASLPSG